MQKYWESFTFRVQEDEAELIKVTQKVQSETREREEKGAMEDEEEADQEKGVDVGDRSGRMTTKKKSLNLSIKSHQGPWKGQLKQN